MPVIPIILTLGTLGTLYYTRSPVAQLRQGKTYKIFVNVDSAMFQGGAAADTQTVANTILGFLQQAGFQPARFRSSGRGPSPTITTYVFDGTWTRGEQYINTAAPPGIGASFYEKLPLL